jgi:hypothetical protein
MTKILFTAVLLPSLLLAQDPKATAPLSAKAFLPDDHRLVASVDLAAMRTRGIWEELQVSALNLVFQQMEQESGFPLAHVDRVSMVAQVDPHATANGPAQHRVMVVEGNADLALHERFGGWDVVQVGGREARRRGQRFVVQPEPKLLVQGDEAIVRPVLEGKANRGTPCADIQSLLSGRADQLAWLVFDLTDPGLGRRALAAMFSDTTWPDDDAPTFACLRLLVLGDVDDPHLGFEAVLRHAKVGAGLDVSEQAVDAALQKMQDDPKLRSVKTVLTKTEKKRDHADLVYKVDLGRARVAVGHAAMLVLPMFAPTQVEEVRAAVPVAPEKPK